MDNYNTPICCACLCPDRSLKYLNDFWKTQCFLQILSEIPMSTNSNSIWLCWECEALVTRFTGFKQQVKYSYRMLQEYLKQNKELNQLHRTPKLQVNRLKSIDISPKDEEMCPTESIKQENDTFEDAVQVEITKIENVDTLEVDDGVYSDNEELHSFDEVLKKRKRGRPRKILNGSCVERNVKLKKKKRKKSDEESLEVYKVITLTLEEVTDERRLLASRDVYENSNIKCERCILSFPNVDDLQDHFTNKHNLNKTSHKCNICDCTFSNEVSYNYHMNKHLIRYQCILCTERLPSKRSAIKHYESNHSTFDNIYTCKLCNLNFRTGQECDDHRQSHEVSDKALLNNGEQDDIERTTNDCSFSCEFCDKTFKWKTSLNKHSEMHRIQAGQKRKPYCETCRLTFTTTSNLQKHVKTSSKHQIQLKLRKLKESLPEEGRSADKDQACIQEIKNNINSTLNKFPCPHCDKKFQWKGNLHRHIQSHEAKVRGQLVCEPCRRTFSSIATYKQHMKISKKHVSENDFKYMCSDCGKKFPNKTSLKDHVDWEHLKNYVHKCTVCQKVFKSHTSLYLHKKVVHRRDDGDHLCDHCGKPFPNHAKLRTHITAMHTSEQPYKCKICGASFSWHSCLSRHVKVVHHKLKVKRKKRNKEDV